jgi:integrase
MSLERSFFASKKYPNLVKYPDRANWVFRKYSKEKRREFKKSTGIEDDEAKAYRVGLEMFNQWLGVRLDQSGRSPLIRDIGRAVLSAKETKRENTYRSFHNQLLNHVLPAFGHLKPEQVTSLLWNQYDAEERRRGKRTKLFNTRKTLIEILNRAKEEGLIKAVPKLKNHDQEARSGKYLDDLTVQRLIRASSPQTALLIQIVYRMGARPGEVLQWEFEMISWDKGKHGSIAIPGRITKTGRSREIPLNSKVSELLKSHQFTTQSRFLFPSPHDRDQPMKSYKTGWNTACRKVVCPTACGSKCKKICFEKPFEANLYDLRHTWVTNQAKRGINSVFTAKYADTSVKMIELIYAKAEPEAMQGVAG